MRELHGYHGEHRRHAHDAPAPADRPAARAHDVPKHAAHEALKLRMLTDPAAIARRTRAATPQPDSHRLTHPDRPGNTINGQLPASHLQI